MFKLLATKFRSQWRARSVPSGWDLEIDTSAPLIWLLIFVYPFNYTWAYAEKYRPGTD
jgi:hypothetical protein